jgi:hypothetical protein
VKSWRNLKGLKRKEKNQIITASPHKTRRLFAPFVVIGSQAKAIKGLLVTNA